MSERTRAVRRVGENDDQFAERARWGRFDELCIAFSAALPQRYAAGTVSQYRSDMNSMLLPVLGDTWVTCCDARALDRVLESLDGRSDRQLSALRTLGSIGRWAVETRRWPTDVTTFGGVDYQRAHRRRINANQPARKGEKIAVKHCPTFDDVEEHADALEARARVALGVDATTAWRIGRVPVVQFLTGTRIAETLALQSSNFDDDLSAVRVHSQFDRQGRHVDDAPPLAPPKYGTLRTAALWEWAREELEPVVTAAQGGFLFPRFSGRGRWIDVFERTERAARQKLGYEWVPHYHRHAYVTINLAPVDDGGYGRSIPDVASWVGDIPSTIVGDYWHPGDNRHTAGWSARRPGR